MKADIEVNEGFLNKYPILKYRMEHFAGETHVRGMRQDDSKTCPLMLDDMVVLNGKHYPCVISMREQSEPVGSIDFSLTPEQALVKVRKERYNWIIKNNTHNIDTCKKNCLDVCRDYNNTVNRLNKTNYDELLISITNI